jgi:hypothetical protein
MEGMNIGSLLCRLKPLLQAGQIHAAINRALANKLNEEVL